LWATNGKRKYQAFDIRHEIVEATRNLSRQPARIEPKDLPEQSLI